MPDPARLTALARGLLPPGAAVAAADPSRTYPLLPGETAWALRQDQPGRAARLVFSAKEAAYKAQYPQSRALIGFDGLAVAFTADGFVATFQHNVAPFAAQDRIAGRWARADGLLLTAARL